MLSRERLVEIRVRVARLTPGIGQCCELQMLLDLLAEHDRLQAANAALEADARIGRAVRRMKSDWLLWRSVYGDWRVSECPRDVGEMRGYGATPDAALLDAQGD